MLFFELAQKEESENGGKCWAVEAKEDPSLVELGWVGLSWVNLAAGPNKQSYLGGHLPDFDGEIESQSRQIPLLCHHLKHHVYQRQRIY